LTFAKSKTMKQTLLLIGFLWWHIGFSQTLSPDVFTTSGDYFTSTNNSLSWTIGECITETYSSTNNILTQGFQQSKYNITSVNEITNSIFSVIVYPNPASNFINISSQSTELKKMKVEFLDISGKLIHSESFQNNARLNISEYSNSLYILHVYDDNNGLIKTFKLEKTN
jgi:hypothetical protein